MTRGRQAGEDMSAIGSTACPGRHWYPGLLAAPLRRISNSLSTLDSPRQRGYPANHSLAPTVKELKKNQ